MKQLEHSINKFNLNILYIIITSLFIIVMFSLNIIINKRVQNAHEFRFKSLNVAKELRQSSDDLTKMVRFYVVTKNPRYKTYYQEILDIRNGIKPAPIDYDKNYWNLVSSNTKSPIKYSKKSISLLEKMRTINFTDEEFFELSSSKLNSDILTKIEFDAMRVVDSAKSTDEQKIKAIKSLFDKKYVEAKLSIMRPINKLFASVKKRVTRKVYTAEIFLFSIEILLYFSVILLFVFLWRLRQIFNNILGGSLSYVHKHLTHIGEGNFSEQIILKEAEEENILKWISITKDKLQNFQEKNEHITSIYALLSQCNQAIVRSSNKQELFDSLCRDSLLFGGLQLAWIGIPDENTKELKIISSAGEAISYTKNLHVSIDPKNPSSKGPAGMCFLENKIQYFMDFQNDKNSSPWHKKAKEFNLKSSASIPLNCNGEVMGVFIVYSNKQNAFDEKIKKLFDEMSSDIDYALDNFEKEKKRVKIEEKLTIHTQAIEQSSNVVMITNKKGNIVYVNYAFYKTTGYEESEVIGKNPRFLKSEKTSVSVFSKMWETICNGLSWHGELINKRKNETEYTTSINISPVSNKDGNITHYIAIEDDITDQKKSIERIHYLANYDLLTELPNRAHMNDYFKYTLNTSRRNKRNFAVMFVDIDHFKDINDTLGHSVGDKLLRGVAKRFSLTLREEDIVARQGGDEFILFFPDTDAHSADLIAQKLIKTIHEPCLVDTHELIITISVGIALYPSDGAKRDVLYKNADIAMYRAKEDGRNTYRFFTESMQKDSVRHLKISNALNHAINRNELEVYYQPQISTKDKKLIGVEALLRWNHPDLGSVSPAEFIPIAEENALIIPIGEWVLRTAIFQAKKWIDNGMEPITVAVNLSAIQFRLHNISTMIEGILNGAGLPPEYLELELTESLAMKNPQHAIETMNTLHEKGIRMSIDDFGTGYSSLSYLKKFKIYKLKIDQSFVRDITVDEDDRAIVTSIISMAKNLGFKTIAEGVETIGQLEYLKKQKCDEIQGYYYSKPLRLDEFENFRKKEVK